MKVLFALGVLEVLAGGAAPLRDTARLIAQFATVLGVFAGLFVALAAVIAESQGIRSATFYVFVGLVIAAAGFAAQYLAEASSADTVLNIYGLAAYLATGITGGWVYWLFSGRYAGVDDFYEPVHPIAKSPGSASHATSKSTLKKAAVPASRYPAADNT